MCGIVGLFERTPFAREVATSRLSLMMSALVHRGPDHAGLWLDPARGVALGNQRLAVLDLTPAGHQPMRSDGDRYVCVLNGEIYNHLAIRARLAQERAEPPRWRGTSDTETLVAAIEAWGLAAALERCVGMFALALWDHLTGTVSLARDRAGEKPLYYGRFRDTWIFGSELKALLVHPDCRRVIDPDAFASYTALGYVPAPACIYEGIRKVLPASIVTLAADGLEHVDTYWSAAAVADQEPLDFASDLDAIERTESVLMQATLDQMLSDRPVGAFLSGGIDSSAIVAFMAASGSAHVRTFSLGFDEHAFDEARYAADISAHFRTQHTALYPSKLDLQDAIDRMPSIYDEPFSDASQVPTYLVAKLAAGFVTVALSGDGGDELFGGYPRYRMGQRLWSIVRRVPGAMRPGAGALVNAFAIDLVDRVFARALPNDDAVGARGLRPAQKLGKLGRVLDSSDAESLYWRLLSPWYAPQLSRGSSALPYRPTPLAADGRSVAEAFMLRDFCGYLPDDMLTKVDRASMAVSLESRAPFLDHRVVEFALRVPLRYKFRNGDTKWVLRQVLDRHMPRRLVDRPKMGFSSPVAAWLRGPFKSWAYDLVDANHGDAGLLFDCSAVRRMLDRHVEGLGDYHQPLWNALMYLDWARHADAEVASRNTVTTLRPAVESPSSEATSL